MPFAPSGYTFYRNVMDYGVRGDGVTDDTEAINRAVSDGNRCGETCGSNTVLGALVYFPVGSYVLLDRLQMDISLTKNFPSPVLT